MSSDERQARSTAAMMLREARVLIASRASSRTAEPQLLEAARVVLRELDSRQASSAATPSLPDDLERLLEDPRITLPGEAEVDELIADWTCNETSEFDRVARLVWYAPRADT